MRPSELVRMLLALGGIALWISFPFVYRNGDAANFQYLCHRMTAAYGLDPCLEDHQPQFGMAVFIFTALFFYPFLKFAAALFAPDPPFRSRFWIGAPRASRSQRHRWSLLLCMLGFGWVFVNVQTYPWELRAYWVYWGIWTAWLCAGLVLCWPRARPDLTA